MNMEHEHGNVCGAHEDMGGECGGCGHHHHECGHGHRHLFKVLVKIAILAIVFCFAFKLGELKGMLESRGYFGQRYYGGMMGGYGYQDSGSYGNDVGAPDIAPSTTAPAAPTK